MYQKPEVTRFGSFRDLTMVGWSAAPSDGFTPQGPAPATSVQTTDTDLTPRLS